MSLLDPFDPGPAAARRAAREELSRHEYDAARPSLVVRAVGRLLRALGSALDAASGQVPGGRTGVVLLLLLLVALVAVVLTRLWPARAGARAAGVFAAGTVVSAEEHRRRADALAAGGDLAGAVRERFRAVVRALEERGVLDPRPGRTAVEVAREAGQRVPALAVPVRSAAQLFDEVVYGGRRAESSSYAVLVELDGTVAATRAVRA